MLYQKELDAAIYAVERAYRLCSSIQESNHKIDAFLKSDHSPVTVADLGSQVAITRDLTREFPDIPIIAEEDSRVLQASKKLNENLLGLLNNHIGPLKQSDVLDALQTVMGADKNANGRFWVVDPLDGTKGFLNKRQYAIAVALIEDDHAVLGVLGCPNFHIKDTFEKKGAIFLASKHNGAYVKQLGHNERYKINVNDVSISSDARICESFESGHVSQGIHGQISALLGIKEPPLRIDSQCKYAAVARGDVSIYLRLSQRADYQECIWDHAPGSLIVEEAGGRVTDFSGNPLDYSTGYKLMKNRGIVATNGKLHQKVLDAISEVSMP